MLDVYTDDKKKSCLLIIIAHEGRDNYAFFISLYVTCCLFQLIELLQSSPARGLELSVWIRAVFTAHTAYLMTVSTHTHTLTHMHIHTNEGHALQLLAIALKPNFFYRNTTGYWVSVYDHR